MAYDGRFDPDLDWREARARGFNVVVGPFRVATCGPGAWRFHLDMDERHVNFGGVCHGGVLMTLMDYAMGVGASEASEDRLASTIGMDMQFVAAARPGARLHGETRLVRATRDVCFMEAEVWGDDRLAARASGIFKYLGNPPA